MASTLVGLGEPTLARLGLGEGEIGRLLVEGDRGGLIVVPVSDEASTAVLLEREARIGRCPLCGQRCRRRTPRHP